MINSLLKRLKSFLHIDDDPIFLSIVKGGSLTLVARVLNALLLLIINLFVARLYGSSVVGVLAIVNSFLNITFLFNLFGTNTAVLRLVPEYSTKYSLNSGREVWMRIQKLVALFSPLISVVIIGIGLIWTHISPSSEIGLPYFYIAAILTPFFSFIKLNTEALRAFFHTRLYALANILPALANLVLLLVFIFVRRNQADPLWAFSGSNILVWMVTSYLVVSILPHKNLGSLVTRIPYREILSISLPMGISFGITQGMNYLDTIILGIYRPEAEVGIYSTVVKLAALTSFVIYSINAVSASKFSELHFSERSADLFALAKKSSNLIFWTSLPILLVLIVLGKLLLGFFGSDFVFGYPAMVILVCGQFADAIGGSNSLYLDMTGSQNKLKNIMLAAFLLYIVLNVILIPQMGMIGSAMAKLASSIFWNLTASLLILRQTGNWISYLPGFLRKHT